MNTIAAIAVALHEAQTPAFKTYAAQALQNAQVLASGLMACGYKLVTGWTDNHMVIVDFTWTELDWSVAEKTLDKIGISTSKSTIPDDPNPPFRPSGLRIWLPAMTTRGIKEADAQKIVEFIDQAFKNKDNEEALADLKNKVREFCKNFPVPSL